MDLYDVSDSTPQHRDHSALPPLLHQWNNWHPLSATLPPSHSLPRRVWRCQCRPDCPWERVLNGKTDGVYRHLFLCLADSSSVTWVSIFPLPTLSDFSCTCHIIRFSSQSEFHPDRPWLPKWFFLKKKTVHTLNFLRRAHSMHFDKCKLGLTDSYSSWISEKREWPLQFSQFST